MNGRRLATGVSAGIVYCGVGVASWELSHAVSEQIMIAQDQQGIEACKEQIDLYPVKSLPQDCRNVAAVEAEASTQLLHGMDILRSAYVTLGKQRDEQAFVDKVAKEGTAASLAIAGVAGIIIFAYNRQDRRWCRKPEMYKEVEVYNLRQREVATR